MAEESYRLLQIFNRTLGGGGEDLAVKMISGALENHAALEDLTFQSSDWTGPDAPPLWKQAGFTFYNPHSVKRLREAQARTKAQAWILHNYIPVVSGGVFREALRQKIPLIHYIHNFRPFSVSSYSWVGKNLEPARWPQNFVEEIRQGTWQKSRIKTAFLASFFTSLHLFNQFRAIKAWIAISEFMRQKFISAGVPSEKIFRLYHPWVLRNAASSNEEGNFYLFVGRLIEEKGIIVLIKTWDILRNRLGDATPKLIVGGDGPLAEEVKVAAARNSHIQFRGYIQGEEKHRLFAQCRALIQPAIWWEPLSLVIYEAYDYGKPVLAAASGGMTELVHEGQTGFRHEPGNAEQLAAQVLQMEAQRSVRQMMGGKGREWLTANMSEAVWRKEFLRITDIAITDKVSAFS